MHSKHCMQWRMLLGHMTWQALCLSRLLGRVILLECKILLMCGADKSKVWALAWRTA